VPGLTPLLLPPNRFPHFYAGGEAITRLRGVPAPAERSPEEWLGATTTRHGEATSGLSALPDGRLLRDAVAADPVAWVGPDPMPGGPADVGVLVKLLDAGQRLPVHVHPDRRFAREHLGSCYGKTEAWFVLDARPDATGAAPQVHVGWSDDVDPAALEQAVARQDSAWMLQRLNAVTVRPGDTVLVPAGTAHAIGAGIFVVEVQEPTDFSLLVEWQGFGTEAEAFLGLDAAAGLAATRRTATAPEELDGLFGHVGADARSAEPVGLLPAEADDCFRAHLLAPPAGSACRVDEPGFGVLVALSGGGRLTWDGDGDGLALAAGDVAVVPYAAGAWQVDGDVRAVLCRPAAPARRPAPLPGGAS
jgi:mannose-6-phosphate isomerase